MPVYEYRCTSCKHVFDVLQRIGQDGSELECPSCGGAKPEKLFSAFASSGNDSSGGGYVGGGGGGCATSGFG